MFKRKTKLFVILAFTIIFCSACFAVQQNDTLSPLPTRPASTQEVPVKSVELKWIIPYNESNDLQAERTAVFNDTLKEFYADISLNFCYLPTDNYEEALDVLLASGEEFDIIWGDKGILDEHQVDFMPLNPYLKGEGAALYDQRPAWLWPAGMVEDQIYGIPAIDDFFLQQYFIVAKDSIPVDFTLQTEETVTPMDFMTALRPALEETLGNRDTIAMKPLSSDQLLTWNYSSLAPGIVLSKDAQIPFTPISYYESEFFKDWVTFVRGWYSDGFYPLTPVSSPERYQQASYSSMVAPCGVAGMSDEQMNELLGKPGVAFNAIPPTISLDLVQNSMLFISANTPNAMQCVQLIQLLNEDETLFNTLLYGLEDVDYTYSDDGIDEMPEDVIPSYVLGNVALDRSKSKEYRQNNILNMLSTDKSDVSIGFVFDPVPVQQQVVQVEKVIEQYENRLILGVMNDYEGTLAAFIDSLKSAGLDDIFEQVVEQLKDYYGENAILLETPPEPSPEP